MRGKTRTRSVSACLLVVFVAVVLCSLAPAQAASAPVLQSISPDKGPPGSFVHLYGTGFGIGEPPPWTNSYVSFGPYPAAGYGPWKDDEIVCEVPDIPGVTFPVTGPVTVTTPDGTSNAVSFTVTQPMGITSINPNFGYSSTALNMEITGTGFTSGVSVYFSPSNVRSWEMPPPALVVSNVVVVSDTKITCTVTLPSNLFLSVYMYAPPTFSIGVTVPGSHRSATISGFTIQPNPFLCGLGSLAPVVAFGLVMGMLSLAGTAHGRRRKTSNTSKK